MPKLCLLLPTPNEPRLTKASAQQFHHSDFMQLLITASSSSSSLSAITQHPIDRIEPLQKNQRTPLTHSILSIPHKANQHNHHYDALPPVHPNNRPAAGNMEQAHARRASPQRIDNASRLLHPKTAEAVRRLSDSISSCGIGIQSRGAWLCLPGGAEWRKCAQVVKALLYPGKLRRCKHSGRGVMLTCSAGLSRH